MVRIEAVLLLYSAFPTAASLPCYPPFPLTDAFRLYAPSALFHLVWTCSQQPVCWQVLSHIICMYVLVTLLANLMLVVHEDTKKSKVKCDDPSLNNVSMFNWTTPWCQIECYEAAVILILTQPTWSYVSMHPRSYVFFNLCMLPASGCHFECIITLDGLASLLLTFQYEIIM
jgi:hypothetical protein